MAAIMYREEAFEIIGRCMEVHRELGSGFLEVVYKDALEIEFNLAGIPYIREKKYEIHYKGLVLPRFYQADFVIMDKIILEAKAIARLSAETSAQIINYLAVSKCKLGLLVNFSAPSLEYKRFVL